MIPYNFHNFIMTGTNQVMLLCPVGYQVHWGSMAEPHRACLHLASVWYHFVPGRHCNLGQFLELKTRTHMWFCVLKREVWDWDGWTCEFDGDLHPGLQNCLYQGSVSSERIDPFCCPTLSVVIVMSAADVNIFHPHYKYMFRYTPWGSLRSNCSFLVALGSISSYSMVYLTFHSMIVIPEDERVGQR